MRLITSAPCLGATRAFAIGSLLTFASSCAWNSYGLARVERRENETTRLLRIEVWGVHLVTGTDDAGLTLGHSRRVYMYPRANVEASVDDGAAAPLVSMSSSASDIRPVRVPVNVVRTEGVSIDLSGTRVGINLGLRSRAVLRVPETSSVLLHVSYDSRDPDRTRAVMKGDWE